VKPSRRVELGAFLRSRRARLSAQDVGLTAGLRRRTPGLRREEVAQLAGLSVTWYTWIEQGRNVSVSRQTLGRIADALHLSREEHQYLYALSGETTVEEDDREEVHPVPPSLRTLLDHQREFPAYLLGRYWEIQAWNAAAALLFGDFARRPVAERHIIRYTFCHPAARRLVVDWEARARRLIAEFRADCMRHLQDPPMVKIVQGLEADSADFARLWHTRDVVARAGGTRTFRHPSLGMLEFEQVTLRLANHPDLKLVMHVASDASPTFSKLHRTLAHRRR
jgi:transcriptional regulator with XRE-family HTH domain